MDKEAKSKKFADIMLKLNEVQIPYDAIQIKTFGYASEGYGLAHLLKKLNEILFEEGWSWTTNLIPISTGSNGEDRLFEITEILVNDKPKQMLSVYLSFSILDEDRAPVFVSKSFGGSQIIGNSFGDSLKSAKTDALKKAISYFGLGSAAFRGEVDDQIRSFNFYKKELMEKIKDYIVNNYNIEKDKINKKAITSFISKTLKKEYAESEFDDIKERDLRIVEELISEPDKKASDDAGESKKGKNKIKPNKKEVDKQLGEDEEPVEESN